MLLKILISLLSIGFTQEKKDVSIYGWKMTNESEVSLVVANGNTESETTTIKQENQILKNKNVYRFKASFLRTKEEESVTGKSWSLALRYERELAKKIRALAGVQSERDPFSGFNRRNSYDLGAKYFFLQKETVELLNETNYRHTEETSTTEETNSRKYVRFYLEWNQKWNKDLKSGIWTEYLHNTEDEDAYFANGEVSLSYILSNYISLKVSYLLRYQNQPLVAGIDKLDELYTTSLVASF